MKFSLIRSVRSIPASLGYYVKGCYNRFQEDDILLLSSGVAFNGILCLIPLMLLLTSVLGIVLNSSDLAVQRIDEVLTTAFPPQPYAQKIKSSIQDMVRDIIRYRRSFGLFGIGVLIWTTGSLFTATRTVLNRIYRVTSQQLLIIGMLKDLLYVLLVGALFILSNILPWLISFTSSILKTLTTIKGIDIDSFMKSIPGEASIILTFLMFFIVYRYVPAKGVNFKMAAVSSLTTTILWVALGRSFRWYLLNFGSFGQLYGTYAFILVLLIWSYYSSFVFVFGAIIGQLFQERHPQVKESGGPESLASA